MNIRNSAKSEPTNTDTNQIGIEWVSLEELGEKRIYPKALVKAVQDVGADTKRQVYLGDVN